MPSVLMSPPGSAEASDLWMHVSQPLPQAGIHSVMQFMLKVSSGRRLKLDSCWDPILAPLLSLSPSSEHCLNKLLAQKSLSQALLLGNLTLNNLHSLEILCVSF